MIRQNEAQGQKFQVTAKIGQKSKIRAKIGQKSKIFNIND